MEDTPLLLHHQQYVLPARLTRRTSPSPCTVRFKLRFENESEWEDFMPQVLEADVTELVKPYYDKGLEEGIEKGIEKGMEKGALTKAHTAARRLLQRGIALDIIADATGLSENEIKRL